MGRKGSRSRRQGAKKANSNARGGRPVETPYVVRDAKAGALTTTVCSSANSKDAAVPLDTQLRPDADAARPHGCTPDDQAALLATAMAESCLSPRTSPAKTCPVSEPSPTTAAGQLQLSGSSTPRALEAIPCALSDPDACSPAPVQRCPDQEPAATGADDQARCPSGMLNFLSSGYSSDGNGANSRDAASHPAASAAVAAAGTPAATAPTATDPLTASKPNAAASAPAAPAAATAAVSALQRYCKQRSADVLALVVKHTTGTTTPYMPGLSAQLDLVQVLHDSQLPDQQPDGCVTRKVECCVHRITGVLYAKKTYGTFRLLDADPLHTDAYVRLWGAAHALAGPAARRTWSELAGCEVTLRAVAAVDPSRLAMVRGLDGFDVEEVAPPKDLPEAAPCGTRYRYYQLVTVCRWASGGSVAARLREMADDHYCRGAAPWLEVLDLLAGCCGLLQLFEDAGLLQSDFKVDNVVFEVGPDGRITVSAIDNDGAQWLREADVIALLRQRFGFVPCAPLVQLYRRLHPLPRRMCTAAVMAPEVGKQGSVCQASHIYQLLLSAWVHLQPLLAQVSLAGRTAVDDAAISGLQALLAWCTAEEPENRPTPAQLLAVVQGLRSHMAWLMQQQGQQQP